MLGDRRVAVAFSRHTFDRRFHLCCATEPSELADHHANHITRCRATAPHNACLDLIRREHAFVCDLSSEEILERRGTLPLGLVAVLLLALAVTGAVVSWLAVSFIQRLPLVESLRAE